MARTHFLFLALAAGFCLPQWALAFNVYKVGGDVDCPYTNIQDAIDAAAANPGADYVWIAMNGTYTGQHVLVNNDTDGVIIVGGLVDCNDNNVDTATTTVSGAGNDGSAVFTIRGNSSVLLQNLFITGAQRDGNASGGGVDFDGSGFLGLRLSSISLNSAGYGGGINAKGDGGHVDVVLEDNSLVLNNTAQTSGGGIRVEGDTRLYVLQPQTLIGFNHAPNGYGGGIEVLTPAHADIGSPGFNGGAVVQFNDAANGGGVAIVGLDFMQGNISNAVQIFTTDSNNPVQIANNSASQNGGGIYVETNDSAGYDVQACIYDFRIHDNVARDGAAIFATGVEGNKADILLNRTSESSLQGCGPDTPPALGAVACAVGVPCNEIVDNISEDGSGQPTAGSTIRGDVSSLLFADRLVMRGNQGGHTIEINGSGDTNNITAKVELSNCLLAANTDQTEVISAHDGGGSSHLHVNNCTIVDNASGSSDTIYSNLNFVEITNDIFDQLGQQVIDFSGAAGDLTAQYVLATNVSTLAGGVALMDGEPDYLDRSNGDYHLLRTSLGVDFAPSGTGSDLDRRPRTVDLIDIPNAFGPMDLGAYEIQNQIVACAVGDTIFCDGFDSQ
jgi:parallel beta-helix repeat protein/predicted outer membrane repeat protein